MFYNTFVLRTKLDHLFLTLLNPYRIIRRLKGNVFCQRWRVDANHTTSNSRTINSDALEKYRHIEERRVKYDRNSRRGEAIETAM